MKENTPPESPPELRIDDYNDDVVEEEELIDILDEDLYDHVSEDMSDLNEEESLSDEEIIPERDDAKFVFANHTDGVLCSAFHPKLNNVVATGGMDDNVYVWDITNGSVLFNTKVHEESVEVIGFSHDGKYLATCDLNGCINIWNSGDYRLARQFELDDELGWSLWHHGSNVLICSSQKGLIYMYKIVTGDQKMVMAPFGSTSICGKVFPDGKRLACGYSEGNLKIIDLKQGIALSSIKLRDENSKISCLDVHRDNNLLICGCDNGDVVLLNSKPGKILTILNSSTVSNLCNYIEAIAFCKDRDYQVAASGSLDGNLIIWDIVSQTARHRTSLSSSINHLVWHPVLPLLYTSHTDGIVNVYDSKSGRVLREFMGHRKCIYSISLSPDGKSLITTSEDKTVRIYKTDEEQ